MSTNSVLNQGLAPQFTIPETIRALTPALAPIDKIFTTDFSYAVAEKGQVVHSRFGNLFTASTYDRSTGFVAADADATDVAVTLANHNYVMTSFTDTEASTITVAMLKNTFIPQMSNAVVKSLFDDAIAQTTAAAYPGTPFYSGNKAGFTRQAVAAGATKMTKANIQFDGRSLLLTPDAFGALLQDPTIAQYLSIGDTGVIRDNKVGRLHGMDVYEVNTWGAAPSGEHLNGIASARGGHVIVTRVPGMIQTGGGLQEVVVEPDSGFSFALRQWYDWTKGLTNLSCSWITGTAVANPDAALRVVISDL